MSISEHSNGLASTIDFKCNRRKQEKRLSNHNFPLHLPQQTKHHSCDPRYAALVWYSNNFQWVFGTQLIGGGGRESKGIDVENFFDCAEAYFQLTPSGEQKGIRELREKFKKHTYNCQTTSHQDSFYVSIF